MTTPWLDLPLHTVTPAFFGKFDVTGPTPAEVPFPIPSLRGVLAYWLRALAGAHIGDSTSLLHDVESAVFGAARTSTTGGPSPIQLRARRVRLSELSVARDATGLRYLMGPGLSPQKKDEPRPRYLAPGPIELRVRNAGKPAHADLFLAALWALRTFGGIGARTRRGFGTLAVGQPLELPAGRFDPAWLARDAADDLGAVLRCVAAAAIGDLGITLPASQPASPASPRYPCFLPDYYRLSADTEDELARGGDWHTPFEIAGEWLRAFRHGADRRIPGSPPAHHSQSYTDVAQPFLNHQPQRGPITAAALGLPVPYSDHQGPPKPDNPREFSQRRAMVDVLIDGQSARRASPLWLRVRRDSSAWRLRSLVFHAEWLPPSPQSQLRITSGRRSEPVTRPADAQIRDELERWFGP